MRFSIVSLFVILIFGCSDKSNHQNAPRGFYYWQTSLSEFNWDDSTYKALRPAVVYYRFFDVEWSKEAGAPIPVSPLRDGYSNWVPQALNVPVVFITNETFQNLNRDGATRLAQQVHRKVMMQFSSLMADAGQMSFYSWEDQPNSLRSKNFDELARHDSAFQKRMELFSEIQFDCDWTESTRDKYFTFLEAAKGLFTQQRITSTIRLYQYKYPDKAGVPPVTRGVLMCYNAGDVRRPETENSIFNVAEIMSYLERTEAYPLPLDYALPVFQWSLLFQHDKLTAILPGTLVTDYQQYVSTSDETTYTVQEEFVYGHTDDGIFLRVGDKIRLERANLEDVRALASWLGKNSAYPDSKLIVYHLNTYDIQTHSKEIEAIFSSF